MARDGDADIERRLLDSGHTSAALGIVLIDGIICQYVSGRSIFADCSMGFPMP